MYHILCAPHIYIFQVVWFLSLSCLYIFPGLIDDAKLPYESEKFMDLLQNQSEGNRKLLMYAKLLPDPTILPGILIQGGVFLLFGLAFYNVGGIGDYLAENVPAACSFLPIRSCMGA